MRLVPTEDRRRDPVDRDGDHPTGAARQHRRHQSIDRPRCGLHECDARATGKETPLDRVRREERQQYALDVIANAHGSRDFHLNGNFTSLPIVLDSGNPDPHGKLAPMVRYDSLEDPIYLEPSAIRFELEQSDPVIRLEKDGVVHALHSGNATIVGYFDGIVARIPVHVYDEKRAYIGHFNPYVHQTP